ncbi:MAG: phosphoribosylamine--glycine ligase [Muribaculaceae bacterium]|nr:phosphoribosylamine--glycine ligase [Muribaculaceae bacterium]
MQHELNILILGNNGRESALAEAILRSTRCRHLYADYHALDNRLTHIELDPMDFATVADFCRRNDIDMVVVGPPEPITAGIRDFLSGTPELSQLKIIAPTASVARLEGSKEFAKEFMSENGIPSPRFMPVDEDTLDEGLSYLESMTPPYVIKADGLYDGRGVVICDELAEAKDILEDMVLDGSLGEAGRKVLIEEYIDGPECSVIIALDGSDYVLLPIARDYKRLNDGDTGPNTPGMGAYSPVALADEEFIAKVEKHIILPTIRALKESETDYQGFLYFGLIAVEGEPVMLEYNVRLGDPEAQAILPRITSDIVDMLESIADRSLADYRIEISDQSAVAVILTDPETPTERTTVTAIADTLAEARAQVYAVIESICKRNELSDAPQQIYFRTDIGG